MIAKQPFAAEWKASAAVMLIASVKVSLAVKWHRETWDLKKDLGLEKERRTTLT